MRSMAIKQTILTVGYIIVILFGLLTLGTILYTLLVK